MESKARAHVWIRGRVQGVAFRWETQRVAEVHGLTGWVRNLPDGRVEAVFEGDRKEVEAVIHWCRQGPPIACVENIRTEWEAVTGEFTGFVITG
ncbi:MAG: acylphosphatase [Desulfobacterales bacterium]